MTYTFGTTFGGGGGGAGGGGLGGSRATVITPHLTLGHAHVAQAAGGIVDTGLLVAMLLGLLGLVTVLTVVGVLIIVIVANRADPDPSGRRPLSVYLFGMSFVTLLTAVAGSVAVVGSLVSLMETSGSAAGDAVARGTVLGALITAVSVAVLVVHLRRGLRFAIADGTAGPSQRIARSYVAAVAFVSVLLLVLSAITAAYLVFVLAGPGVFGFGVSRTVAGEALIVAAYVAAVAVLILVTHRNLVSPGLRFLREPTPWTPAGPAGTAMPAAPAAPVVTPRPAGPAPTPGATASGATASGATTPGAGPAGAGPAGAPSAGAGPVPPGPPPAAPMPTSPEPPAAPTGPAPPAPPAAPPPNPPA
ncbi:MAG TPA: hypothetical protein VHB02_03920 [Acidimicrobiales bacterium]|nr:hypothetical protein [Acidimicrobiales bacterium]